MKLEEFLRKFHDKHANYMYDPADFRPDEAGANFDWLTLGQTQENGTASLVQFMLA
jgi:hypothetical protein